MPLRNMGRKCVAIGCNSSMNGKTSIMFHKFPYRDPNRMLKWLELCPPDLTTDKGRILLCSRHFRRDQYLNINAKRPKLVHNAVPFMKRNPASGSQVRKTQNSGFLPTCNSNEIDGKQPLVWIPVQEDVDESEQSDKDNESHDFQHDIEDSLTVEVNMKDGESTGSFEFVRDDPAKCSSTTSQTLILENIRLKMAYEDLKTELNSSKERVAFLEKQVHNLSRLASLCQCSFTNDSTSS
ncbi:uncharacterized protein LOC130686630 [Daphnia carinata]|uniref:uncharacterized protein LOC130686630 n=1 Tax=Daphnia carinata TaxID=120202 RepID=UPI002579E3CB|nr:uncharacterized protein LOC130686630 [Daphnia carinata]